MFRLDFYTTHPPGVKSFENRDGIRLTQADYSITLSAFSWLDHFSFRHEKK